MTSLITPHGVNGFPEPTQHDQRETRREKKLRWDREYRNRDQREERRRVNEQREFIFWDGEGINLDGPGKPQAYVLFGASTGERIKLSRGSSTLTFGDCAELILAVGRENPTAYHVGFGFDYDINQIVRTLPYRYLEWLNTNGSVKFGPYRIAWRHGKTLTISKYTDSTSQSVTIYDLFSFFTSSFVKALQTQFAGQTQYDEIISFIADGKKRRKDFTLRELESEIIPYWEAELEMGALLASNFRDLLYAADFPISQWYGPGAIASLVLRNHNIHAHMSEVPEAVNLAAQYAYAGGRFELFRIGRHVGPVWSIDINSAYPNALALLPSLASGKWLYQEINKQASEISYKDIVPFAIYHVELSHKRYRIPFSPHSPPSPLFHRTSQGEMMFPWHTDGWYWGPEVRNLCHKSIADSAKIVGAWVFYPVTDVKPFAFIRDMYQQRSEWKKAKRPEQLALKLAMNSIYGKLAQRVGWERKQSAPTWHQLEWAGFVTSYVRAHLWRTMYQLGDSIVSVETDGIYVTKDPESIGITADSELGGWSVDRYDEIIYLQSGTYWIRQDDHWSSKYRGLDPDSLTREAAEGYLQELDYKAPKWPAITGTTTRYIGLGAAMSWASGVPQKFRNLHGVWFQNQDRDIRPGENGKRTHVSISCVECHANQPPYNHMHYQSIGVCIDPANTPMSTKHYLPWLDGKAVEKISWRKELKFEQGKLFEI